MDPAAWSSYYSRLNAGSNAVGSGGGGGVAGGVGVNASADLSQCYSANSLILAQLRDVEALSAQPVASYSNMGLPPSLVHAATQAKLPQQHYQQLQQQALANLNVVTNSASLASNGLQNGRDPHHAFLSASNAVQSPWKAVAPSNNSLGSNANVGSTNGIGSGSRASSSTSSSSFNSSQVDSNNALYETPTAVESGVPLPNVMRQAVELKTSQPIFPGQPPPLSRLEKREPPPPRQSSQTRNNRLMSQQQQLQTNSVAFREYSNALNQQQKVPRQSPTQPQPLPSPQHYFDVSAGTSTNNSGSSPQQVAANVSSAFFQANSPLQQQQLQAQQQQLQQQRQRQQQEQQRQLEQRRLQEQQRQHEQQRQQEQQQRQRQQEQQRRQVEQEQERQRQQEEQRQRQQQEQQRQCQQQEQQRQQQQQLQHSFLSQASQQVRTSGQRGRSKKTSTKETSETLSSKGIQQLQSRTPVQSINQLGFQSDSSNLMYTSHQDVALARLGALGTLTDVPEGDLLQSMHSSLSYDELDAFGPNNSPLKAAVKSIDRAPWLNRAADLLDLSASERQDSSNSVVVDMLNNTNSSHQQQEQEAVGLGTGSTVATTEQQGLIPQFVMNPWDPTQKPVLTLAPPLSAMHAYQMQIQMQPQHQQQQQHQQQPQQQQQQQQQQEQEQQEQEQQQRHHQEDEEEKHKCRVLCKSPEEELGFLLNLPPPCNVVIMPSTIGLTAKGIRDTPFFAVFKKFLKGEVISAVEGSTSTSSDTSATNPLPGKKAYVPPYTPKSSNTRGTTNNNCSNTSSLFGRGKRGEGRQHQQHKNLNKGISNEQRLKTTRIKSVDKDLTEDERIAMSLLELPKREQSRRKAKERRRFSSNNNDDDGDEEPEVIGIDLSDSDDEDATWTPFKDNDTSSNIPTFSTVVKRPKRAECTRLIQQEEAFSKGDFMILKSDVNKENAPIWRLESRTTLQRFNFVKSSQYEGAKLFAAFNRHNRHKYVSVSVRILEGENDSKTQVQVVRKSLENNNDVNFKEDHHIISDSRHIELNLRKRSFNETSQFLEAFEVYVQAIFSECLDKNFLQGVFQDSDAYFVSNLEKVDSVTLLRKDKVMTGTTWPSRLLTSLNTWPCLNDLGLSAVQDTNCNGCEKERAATLIQLLGQPYDQSTLHPTTPVDEAVSNRNFSLCPKCLRLALLYHRLFHSKKCLFDTCSQLVNKRIKKGEGGDYEKLLKDLLADESWLEQQFRKMQELWADADTFVR